MKTRVIFRDNLINGIRALDKTREKMEMMYGRGDLSRKEIEQIYGLLFIDCLNIFGSCVENFFIGLLTGNVKKSSKVYPRLQFKSYIVARDIIRGTKPYISWLPYENTTKLANIYFRNGKPFTFLSTEQENSLRTMTWTRNAIAHKSRFATNKFEKAVIGNLTLLPREKKPCGFLRSLFRISPKQSRMENGMSEIISIAATILQ